MFLEIHCGRLYVDGESTGCGDYSRHADKASWVEGVSDEERFSFALHWAWSDGEVDWHEYVDEPRVAALSDARKATATALAAGISGCASSWSLSGLILLVVPAVLMTGYYIRSMISNWQRYRTRHQQFENEIQIIDFNYPVVRCIRWLLQSGLSQNARKSLEAGAGVSVGRINTGVVSIHGESVTLVVRRNPELIEFIGREYSAKLSSPEEYRRRAFDVLYGYIQDEIDRLKAAYAAAKERWRIEAERKATEEVLRRSREEREALVAAEADRASRVSSLPFILGETKDEVIGWGSLSQAMLEADTGSPTETESSKEPKKA